MVHVGLHKVCGEENAIIDAFYALQRSIGSRLCCHHCATIMQHREIKMGAGVMASATEDSLDERGGGGTSHMRKRSLIGTPVPPPIGAVVHP
jgi:hypothetical protein